MSAVEREEWIRQYEGRQPDLEADDAEGEVEGYEFVPPGTYRVRYCSHEVCSPRALSGRIKTWFVITSGDEAGQEVPWWCVVTITDRKAGRWRARKNSKLLRTLQRVTGRRYGRRDRVSLRHLEGIDLIAEVVTVSKRQDGKAYEADEQYSKIESLRLAK